MRGLRLFSTSIQGSCWVADFAGIMVTLARRGAFLAVFAAALVLALPDARAQIELDVTQGNIKPLTIALPDFGGNGQVERQYGANIVKVISANLAGSGLFRPVDPRSFIEKISGVNQRPKFASWRVINTQALVTGKVTRLSNGRLRADFRLWDVFASVQMTGLQFSSSQKNWRRIAHLISDAIYKRLTGEDGYFDTRIVFIDETGPKNKRVKRLAIMDQDGQNVRYLTRGSSLVLTPRFSPKRQEITYMSYAGGRPRVYLLNIETGKQEVVGDFPGMTFSPRFSPDGQRIVMSLQRGSNSNIYSMDLRSRRTTRLTNSSAIDTGPSYSPNGRRIVFESDRGGSQQIYVMSANGGTARRISFGAGRYSTPVWSPRGDLIAFTKLQKGQFMIGVMRADGSGERILTTGFHNEGPTWSPNGRVLMFFRETRGEKGGPNLFSVDLTGYNERRVATPSFASDPAWSPLVGQ